MPKRRRHNNSQRKQITPTTPKKPISSPVLVALLAGSYDLIERLIGNSKKPRDSENEIPDICQGKNARLSIKQPELGTLFDALLLPAKPPGTDALLPIFEELQKLFRRQKPAEIKQLVREIGKLLNRLFTEIDINELPDGLFHACYKTFQINHQMQFLELESRLETQTTRLKKQFNQLKSLIADAMTLDVFLQSQKLDNRLLTFGDHPQITKTVSQKDLTEYKQHMTQLIKTKQQPTAQMIHPHMFLDRKKSLKLFEEGSADLRVRARLKPEDTMPKLMNWLKVHPEISSERCHNLLSLLRAHTDKYHQDCSDAKQIIAFINHIEPHLDELITLLTDPSMQNWRNQKSGFSKDNPSLSWAAFTIDAFNFVHLTCVKLRLAFDDGMKLDQLLPLCDYFIQLIRAISPPKSKHWKALSSAISTRKKDLKLLIERENQKRDKNDAQLQRDASLTPEAIMKAEQAQQALIEEEAIIKKKTEDAAGIKPKRNPKQKKQPHSFKKMVKSSHWYHRNLHQKSKQASSEIIDQVTIPSWFEAQQLFSAKAYDDLETLCQNQYRQLKKTDPFTAARFCGLAADSYFTRAYRCLSRTNQATLFKDKLHLYAQAMDFYHLSLKQLKQANRLVGKKGAFHQYLNRVQDITYANIHSAQQNLQKDYQVFMLKQQAFAEKKARQDLLAISLVANYKSKTEKHLAFYAEKFLENEGWSASLRRFFGDRPINLYQLLEHLHDKKVHQASWIETTLKTYLSDLGRFLWCHNPRYAENPDHIPSYSPDERSDGIEETKQLEMLVGKFSTLQMQFAGLNESPSSKTAFLSSLTFWHYTAPRPQYRNTIVFGQGARNMAKHIGYFFNDTRLLGSDESCVSPSSGKEKEPKSQSC